jgi:hypothetical protein
MPELYPIPPFLAPGQPWPPTNVHGVNYRELFEDIRANRELFKGKHTEVFAEQYKRLNVSTVGDATENRDPVTMQELLARLAAARGKTAYEQEIDLPQALSLLWADLLAAKPPRIGAGVFAATAGSAAKGSAAKPGDAEQAAIQRLTTDLVSEIHEAYVEQSYAGDGVFVARWTREGGGRVIAYPADQVISWSATGDPKAPTCHVLFTLQPEKPPTEAPAPGEVQGLPSILAVEIHYRGMVRYRRYKVTGGRIAGEVSPVLPEGAVADQSLPGVTEFLVQPFKNIATPGDWRGVSDYNAIETLVAEFDVRASQWGKLNDKFTAPTMYGPADVLERDEETGHWVYRTSPDGKYIPVSKEDDVTPGYLVWDPQFNMQLETWDRLMDAWYLVTGTTPAAFSMFNEGGGGQLSGIALRLRMARPLQVAGRKRERGEPALRRVLLAAQQLETTLGGEQYRPTLPVFEWPDGLPSDPKEQAETESGRKTAGLTSTKRALMRLDGLSESEAEEEADEIAAEQAANNPFAPPGTDLNGPSGQEVLQRARQIQAENEGMSEQEAIDKATAELKKRAPPGARAGD